MSRRNRERRRGRQEQQKQPPRQGHPKQGPPTADQAELADFLRNFEKLSSITPPASWPGACDPGMARPDLLKLALADFAVEAEPGRSRCRQLERHLEDGLIDHIPNLIYWSVEEFLWHGLPGDSWHPIDAFLAREQETFAPAAAAQLRRWKDARIGFFEVGAVANDQVTLREWDAAAFRPLGGDFPAISLNIGGVNFFREHMDGIHLTYVAPWAPSEGLFCAMGYGPILTPQTAPFYLPLLGLRNPEVVARPLPWKTNPVERLHYSQAWRQRNWPDWLAGHLVFPFQAVISGPQAAPEVHEITALMPSTPDAFRDFGLYLEFDLGNELAAAGATGVRPIEPASPNAMPLAEYRAYRALVGPPKAVVLGT